MESRFEVAKFIVEYLYELCKRDKTATPDKTDVEVDFSVLGLKEAYLQSNQLFKRSVDVEMIEDALFYLSRIDSIKIEGGFLVTYNQLTLERTETNNRKSYTKEDYAKLNQFYESRIQQIHIVGEYAKKMIVDYRAALQFVDDYFQMDYNAFLSKYFNVAQQNEMKRNITPAKFKQLFGELSPSQLGIIKDRQSKHVVVAAGPGSGKTRVLVHKLASLLLMEDVKHEQLLMLTFSRAAAIEFKQRLFKLIGNAAAFIEIKTFHSYCFDLLGRVGNLDKTDHIIKDTIAKIENEEVERNRITKSVLVIDEAQDMDQDEFMLVQTLIEQNEDIRVVVVGDDDQNIYAFRGADSKYLKQFLKDERSIKYELIENYRSRANLIDFTNHFLQQIPNRLKETPVVAVRKEQGNIKVVNYPSQHLIAPLVNDVITSKPLGSTCILTKTNDEALQVAGLLLKNNIKAKLIQTNDAFLLNNLLEVRAFIYYLRMKVGDYVISDRNWEEAKLMLHNDFASSNKLEICENIIKHFEIANPKRKYKTDLDLFIQESKLEDFYHVDEETILVSTMHKAKGRELDNVFHLLNHVDTSTIEEKRLLYVAMTRAKQNLSIHLNTNALYHVAAPNVQRYVDKSS